MESNTTHTSIDAPKEAYLFFPKPVEEKTKPDKAGIRYFFYGQIEHDDYEKRKLKEYHEYLAKEKLPQFADEYWTQQKILLLLCGNKYKPQKTYKAIKEHDTWRRSTLPIQITPVYQELLRKGFFYISGRDYQFRPILVMNAKLIDYERVENFMNACIYLHELVIKHMLLPGQIENWHVIYDLGNMGLTEIPIGAVKKVTGVISSNYGGRLFRMFIINAPTAISFSWKMFSGMLDEVTVEKISIKNNAEIPEIFKHCDSSQVEVRYSGTQPNRTEFWPLSVPEPVVKADLISQDEYKRRLKDGKLVRNRVSPFIKIE